MFTSMLHFVIFAASKMLQHREFDMFVGISKQLRAWYKKPIQLAI